MKIATPSTETNAAVYEITPAVAAVLYVEHNKWNRDVSLAKDAPVARGDGP